MVKYQHCKAYWENSELWVEFYSIAGYHIFCYLTELESNLQHPSTMLACALKSLDKCPLEKCCLSYRALTIFSASKLILLTSQPVHIPS